VPVARRSILYGLNCIDQYRLAASYVNRILRCEKPPDLPVQAPTKNELVVNLKTAKALCRRRCLVRPSLSEDVI
jgi:hypothetical protein